MVLLLRCSTTGFVTRGGQEHFVTAHGDNRAFFPASDAALTCSLQGTAHSLGSLRPRTRGGWLMAAASSRSQGFMQEQPPESVRGVGVGQQPLSHPPRRDRQQTLVDGLGGTQERQPVGQPRAGAQLALDQRKSEQRNRPGGEGGRENRGQEGGPHSRFPSSPWRAGRTAFPILSRSLHERGQSTPSLLIGAR